MQMLLVVYRITIERQHDEFEAAYREYKPHMSATSGHYGEHLVRSESNPNQYAIISQWHPEAFAAWLQSPQHQEIVAILNTFKSDRALSKRYIVLQHYGHSFQVDTQE